LLAGFLLALGITAPGSVAAQTMRLIGPMPQDCRSLLPQGARGTFQDWRVFVELEHCDRIKRLRRIAEILPPDEQPMFYETRLPAWRLPSNIATDVPVLRVVFPERTFFDTDSSRLRPEAIEIAALIAENLRKEPPDVALFIAGHADARGTREYNEALSVDRSNAIAEQIFQFGVSLTSIWRIGFGEDMPLVAGNDEAAFARNRRIEFLFAAKPEAMATWLADNQLDNLCQARNRSDAERCKASLSLKADYTVREVVQAPARANLAVKRLPVARIAPGSKALGSVAPSSPTIGVKPKPARTISINPQRRSAGTIQLNL